MRRQSRRDKVDPVQRKPLSDLFSNGQVAKMNRIKGPTEECKFHGGIPPSLANLAITEDNIFGGGQIFRSHWAAGMQLLRADANFSAKTKDPSVGKSC